MKRIEERKLESERIGIGVSSEAQSLFNALCKTIKCRWEKA